VAKSDRFLKACKMERPDCTPVWLMRQAGRYMEEYRSMRERHSFVEMCKTPELAAEVTLQPVLRFDLDAAIIFSDILLPLEKMGVEIHFDEAAGPVVERPVRSARDVEALRPVDPAADLPYLPHAIRTAVSALSGRVPLIGFAGAPFTLAAYLIEGGTSKHYQTTKAFMYADGDAFRLLMEKLTDLSAACLAAQIEAGVRAVQVFDSWVGTLSAADYERYVMDHMVRLFESLDGSVPAIHFGVDTCHLLNLMSRAGGDVIGVDWRLPLDEAWETIGRDRAIQGNLDPAALLGPDAFIEERAADIIRRAGGRGGHVFNLGHGVLPETPVEKVDILVRAVHECAPEVPGEDL